MAAPGYLFALLIAVYSQQPVNCYPLTRETENEIKLTKSISSDLPESASLLIEWAKETGILDPDDFELRLLGPGYRGLFALKDFPALTPVIALPLTSIMASHGDQIDAALAPIMQMAEGIFEFKDGQVNYHRKLALWLAMEKAKGTTSHWFPYINHLPNKTTTCVDFTEEEQEQLRGTHIFFICKNRRKRFLNEYQPVFGLLNTYFPKLAPWQNIQEEHWLWAHQMLNTRNFQLKYKEYPDTVLGMLPFADLFNHANDGMIWEVIADDDGNQTVILYSAQDIKEGDQVFLNYGHYDNAHLLKAYGFELENNPLPLALDCSNDSECSMGLDQLGNTTTTMSEDVALLKSANFKKLSFNMQNIVKLRIETRQRMAEEHITFPKEAEQN